MQKGVRYPIFKCWTATNDDQEGSVSKKANNVSSNDCVTAKEMAGILKVPISWIYSKAHRGIPCLRVGKYLRFNPQEVIEYLKISSKKEG